MKDYECIKLISNLKKITGMTNFNNLSKDDVIYIYKLRKDGQVKKKHLDALDIISPEYKLKFLCFKYKNVRFKFIKQYKQHLQQLKNIIHEA